MCDHASHRPGSRLTDGDAHAADHAAWTRRSFLKGLGLAAAGGTFSLAGVPVRSWAQAALPPAAQAIAGDRVLVLLQLDGGNDGLNTLVPVDDDRYYHARPTLAVPKRDTLPLADGLGLNPNLGALKPYFDEGQLAIVQNVGYPQPNLSHFRSTDIWMSASDADVYDDTGWSGRYLAAAHPEALETPPAEPMAIQIGASSMLFQAAQGTLGMSITSTELFESLAEAGVVYRAPDEAETVQAQEIGFLRRVANDSFRYAQAIQSAATAGRTRAAYPADNDLAEHLAIVSQLIDGGLGTKIYLVTLSGFDTHAEQSALHPLLLRTVGDAVAAFLQDLDLAGRADDVIVMTFSEFGRTIEENGSDGTDHGTGAPLFVLGRGVAGGLYGTAPDLDQRDEYGNLFFDQHFRTVYASVLHGWFGVDDGLVGDVLHGAAPTLPLIEATATHTAPPDAAPTARRLHPSYPNPARGQTTLAYTLDRPAHVRLAIYDIRGREVARLVERRQGAGTYTLPFDTTPLAAGAYLCRLHVDGAGESRPITVVQ